MKMLNFSSLDGYAPSASPAASGKVNAHSNSQTARLSDFLRAEWDVRFCQ